MSQPTHYFINADGEVSIVNPDGYDGLAVELPKGFWDTPKVWTGKEWAEDIDGERARLWAAVKADRDALISGGCDTPSGRVDTDEKSRAAIESKANAARDNPAWRGVWTMEDNTEVEVDAAAMLAIKAAFDAHEADARDRASALRALIYDPAVTTIAKLRESTAVTGPAINGLDGHETMQGMS